jgi:hypothetical protein
MNLVLHPRAAPSDRLRLWLGAFQASSAPALRWFLDGVETVPMPLCPIRSVRPNAMLPALPPPAEQPRVFAGVYEFTGLAANTVYTVTVEGGGDSQVLRPRTLPDRVPATLEGTFNVLLVSCFHQAEDRKGLAGIIVSQLPPAAQPHLTLLMGDQVYLDLPTLQDFPDDEVWLARKFEEDYARNWRGTPGYAQVLDAAPSFSLPDDHEYWNNYPHASPLIGNSWTQAGRDRWRRAALAAYEGFQRPYPFDTDTPATLDVNPLAFFLPDMRTLRDPDRAFLLTEPAHARLERWIDRVIQEKRFGVFVTGQSLFSDPVSALGGAIADFELPNYGDYARVLTQLERLADAGLPALCLTGDVHWGRLTRSTDVRTMRAALYEIISSPSSLVTTVGFDTVKTAGAWIGGLFGKQIPWPRHSDPNPPPAFLGSDALGGRFRNAMLHGVRGNHVALLRFSQYGGGLAFRITYWPLSRSSAVGQPVELGPYPLRTN